MHCRLNFSFHWEKRQNKQKHLLIFFLRKSRLLSPIAIAFIAIQRKKTKRENDVEELKKWAEQKKILASRWIRGCWGAWLGFTCSPFSRQVSCQLSVAEQSTWAWRSPEFSSLELEGVIFHKLRLGSGSPIFSSGPIDLGITQAFSRFW